MKNGKAGFLGMALAIFGGAGLIFGNQMLVSNVLASGAQTEPAIVVLENQSAAPQLTNVGMYSNTNGETYMALTTTSADVQKKDETQETVEAKSSIYLDKNPTDGNLSEETVKEMGIRTTAEKYALTQKDIEGFDVVVKSSYAAQWPSDVADMLIWTVVLKPVNQDDYPTIMNYRAVFDDQSTELMYVQAVPLIKEGTPLANEISSDKAKEIGIAALTKKYSLTQETLDRFTVTLKYYEVTDEAPGKHVWWVNLYPTNTDEFSEIGCYWTYIDAETGDALQLKSAVDGLG